MASQAAPIHRFSLDDVYAMVRAGILDEADRLELVEGVLVEMNPIGPMHAGTVAWLASHLFRTTARNLEVRVQDSFLTTDGGFVQPDLMVIEPVGRERPPAAALLVVEVSDGTRARDDEKATTYAAAVSEYWIVDVDRDELVVHRSPAAGAYASVERFVAGDTVAPLIDAAPVDVGALLGR